jgi:solute carrier family 9B (sodium/hydrogen exchanger), member 1/2
VMGSKYLEFPSAGALGCITASFTAGTGWRRRKAKDATFNCDVEMYLNLLWKFLKPVSFGLIGKEVDFQVLEGNVVLFGFVTLVVGVVFRFASGYLSFCGGNMNWREKAYITLSGFPKATGTEITDLETQANIVYCSKSYFESTFFFYFQFKQLSVQLL